MDCRQSNLNFELFFIEIHQVLREIGLFEHEIQALSLNKINLYKRIFFEKEKNKKS